MPRPEEVAILVIDGREFRDWKSVQVELRWNEPFSVFRFTATEKQPMASSWPALAVRPVATCEVYLAGQLAISGYVTTRQVGTDKEAHGVEIIGKSKTWDLARSSVKSRQANFDGYSWSAIARALTGPFGIGVEELGEIDQTPFPQCHAEPGRLCFAFLEQLARDRKIILGSNERGQLVAVGRKDIPIVDSLIEGQNVLRAQSVLDAQYLYNENLAVAQSAANDSVNGTGASEVEASVPGLFPRYSPLVTPMEQPGGISEAQKRAEFEEQIRRGTSFTADITVQGWVRGNGQLWALGTGVYCTLPMHLMDRPMAIRSITFSQDDGAGTLTTLGLVLPQLFGGRDSLAPNGRTLQPPSVDLPSAIPGEQPPRPGEGVKDNATVEIGPLEIN